MSERRTLVVGTTADYIELITERFPGRAVFLTDRSVRPNSQFAQPDQASELLCSLDDRENVVSQLRSHLKRFNIAVTAVTCYDCEWLSLAAFLAEHFSCPFPTEDAVALARDKYRSKQVWYEQGVDCPRSELVWSTAQALSLCDQFGGPVVLKPLSGSGSELTFRCNDGYDLGIAFRALTEGLARRKSEPIYRDQTSQGTIATRQPILAEQCIKGREFSADFIVEDRHTTLIRVAKKVRADHLSFGTTLAYIVPGRLPGWLSRDELTQKLGRAARKLGLTRAICMADFIITDDRMVLLELTPRIGGDCLPSLIRAASGVDTIGLALDFAEQKPFTIPSTELWQSCIGLRLFATEAGLLTSIHTRELHDHPGVKEIYIKHDPGHEISLPPDDYNSWLLGHLIIESDNSQTIRDQISQILAKISIEVEQYSEQSLRRFHDDGGRTVQPSGPAA